MVGSCRNSCSSLPARWIWLLAGLALSFAPAGCATYQIGNRSLYRSDIRTIAVPIFESTSFRPYLGERLTEAVVKEIQLRTPYRVVSSDAADSVLTGQIVGEQKRVVSKDPNGQPRDIETDFSVQVSWYDRRGNLLSRPTLIPLAPLDFSVAQTSSMIAEAGQSVATAHQQALERLARQIVSQMESW